MRGRYVSDIALHCGDRPTMGDDLLMREVSVWLSMVRGGGHLWEEEKVMGEEEANAW